MVNNTLWSLLPAVVAIILALITKEVYSSLFFGIIIGALLSTGFNFTETMNLIVVDGLTASVQSLAGNACFLVFLGSLVCLVNKSGGSQAFSVWVSKKVKSRRGAGLLTFLMGIVIFIDDYFNCLIVGSSMASITDKHKISREKLAYLIDATAAPICIIMPISSWAAAVAFSAEDIGSGYTGLSLLLRTIPFNFYALFNLIFILCLLVMDFDYGAMKKAQDNFTSRSVGLSSDQDSKNDHSSDAMVTDVLLPIILLIISTTLAMLYAGGFFGATPWIGADNTGNMIASLGDTDSFIALPMGSLITFVISVIYFRFRRTISFKDIMACVPEGFAAMIPSILVLTLASALKTVTGKLGADEYVKSVVGSSAGGLVYLLPAIVFILALVLAFATGTSWGTFGIMIPIVASALSYDESAMIIGISACLAGAVCGDHCSPISDTTIMASAGAQIDHLKHFETQLPYAISVAVISFISYIVAGITSNWGISFSIGVVFIVGSLLLLKKYTQKDQ